MREEALHAGHPAADAIARIARGARAGRIDLAPLAGTELTTFIDEALDGLALPQDVRRAVAIAGEGNPYFTEELLKSAVEQASASGAGRARALPQTVRATLLERLAPFDESERRVIAQAAVIGRTFDVGLLAATLDAEPEALLPALRHARDLQLVEERSPSVFRFRHGLTRDAIYADFLGAEARPRHNAIAQALEAVPDPSATSSARVSLVGRRRRGSSRDVQRAGGRRRSIGARPRGRDRLLRTGTRTAAGAPARAALLQKTASRRLATGATKRRRRRLRRPPMPSAQPALTNARRAAARPPRSWPTGPDSPIRRLHSKRCSRGSTRRNISRAAASTSDWRGCMRRSGSRRARRSTSRRSTRGPRPRRGTSRCACTTSRRSRR